MKIGINARLLSAPTTRGWNRYTLSLIHELSRMGLQLLLYSDSPLHRDHTDRLESETCRVVVSPPMRYVVWEQHWLSRQCALDGVDLLHAPFNFGLPYFSPCPRVLTLHDAIDQAYYRPRMDLCARFRFRAVTSSIHLWIARNRADAIITVSQHAKKDLVNILGIPAEKITVVYEAADPQFGTVVKDFERDRVQLKYDLPRRYILYVGGWERRKNIGFLIRAFAAADLDNVILLLAGGLPEQILEASALVRSLKIEKRVRLLGWVDDADLPALYSQALCFVYPSEYEGFGLQLCESMATGCPVLAARATSLVEVLGAGGDHFDPFDSAELVALLRRVVADPCYRAALASRAQARSREFSWPRTATRTLEVYRRVLGAA